MNHMLIMIESNTKKSIYPQIITDDSKMSTLEKEFDVEVNSFFFIFTILLQRFSLQDEVQFQIEFDVKVRSGNSNSSGSEEKIPYFTTKLIMESTSVRVV